MRNGIFIGALLIAVIGGGLIGLYGDFGAIAGAFGSRPPASSTPADPFGPRLDGLKFTEDATKAKAQQSSGSDYIPAGERGYQMNGCTMPRVQDGTQVVLVGVYSGDALSTVALHSQDLETGVVEVVIEDGSQPLYVVLSNFKPTIWRFSGAVQRIEKAVMVASRGGSPRPASSRFRSMEAASEAASRAARGAPRLMTDPTRSFAGVIGLDATRVTTAEDIRCLDWFSDPGSLKAEAAITAVGRAAGRKPDVVAGYYSLAALRLPSAQAAKGPGRLRPPQGFEPGMWREAVRYSPWGVASIRPDAVISAVDTVTYDVLPNQAGLAQLLGSGALQRDPAGLKIARPIPRFPAELSGAHATQFVLGDGVPMPAGDPGHSCVVSERTKLPVRDGLCG